MVVGDGLAVLRFLIDSHADNTLTHSTKSNCLFIMQLFQCHAKSVPVALNCCYLILLLLPFTSAMFLASECQVETCLVTSLRTHLRKGARREEELVVMCCNAAAKLASIPDGAIRLGRAGMCNQLSPILQRHMDNITVCSAALKLLLQLNKAPSNVPLLSNNAGLCKLVVVITQKYFLRKKCTEVGCAVISSLAGNSDKTRLLLISEGAIDLVTVILHAYSNKNNKAPDWAHSTVSVLTN